MPPPGWARRCWRRRCGQPVARPSMPPSCFPTMSTPAWFPAKGSRRTARRKARPTRTCFATWRSSMPCRRCIGRKPWPVSQAGWAAPADGSAGRLAWCSVATLPTTVAGRCASRARDGSCSSFRAVIRRGRVPTAYTSPSMSVSATMTSTRTDRRRMSTGIAANCETMSSSIIGSRCSTSRRCR
ncbi:hypothetical protein D3C87_1507670 [compost metagenome]